MPLLHRDKNTDAVDQAQAARQLISLVEEVHGLKVFENLTEDSQAGLVWALFAAGELLDDALKDLGEPKKVELRKAC